MTIYGIKNCDTMQKAFSWLRENHISFTFHDYKEKGISKQKIESWLKHFAITELINTKGTTYKNLNEKEKQSISNKSKAIVLMMENTSMIKRPVFEIPGGLLLGFKVGEWEKKLL